MSLFDANCMLGRRAMQTALRIPTTARELLSEMDRLGIAEALVFHGYALDGHPGRGNAQLMKEIEGQARLHPCWMLLPSAGEMAAPGELVKEMKARGVRAARMSPGWHRYAITQANVGDLLAALEQASIPLFLDFGVTHWSNDKTDWRGLDELCPRYPRLPFIVVGEGMGAPRFLFPMWSRHPNLYLETSYYQVHQGLSDVARRFGPERLLFGSGLPVRAAGPPLTQLEYDFLTEEERAAIGGGNLRRLLGRAHGGSEPPAAEPDTSGSSAVRLPSHPIIDAHAHLGDWFRSYANAGWADGLVRTMDRLNIRHTALTAFDAIGPDMRGGNDQVAAAMRAHPGRFLGYATVDPNEPKAMAAELERCFEQLGFHAIKFHCGTHGYPAESERYRPALEYAEARGLCVLIHGSITERLLETYPRAQFLSAHVGGWDGRAPNAAVELSKRHANLFLDLTSSAAWNGAIEALVQEAGAERIVFGSDVPLMDPGYQLGRVLGSLLSADEKRRILYENAARLFRIS